MHRGERVAIKETVPGTAAASPAAGTHRVGGDAADDILLSVEGLSVAFKSGSRMLHAVEGVSYAVRRGEIVAIVGESGCGKSVSSLAIMGLLPKPAARVTNGRIVFDGRDLLTLSQAEMRALRGREIAMIFQEPMTSLNPVMQIGEQILEPLRIHLGMTGERARARVLELIGQVGITDPERRLAQYPHQLSGGMRQRVMIAIALACYPKLLIADEPTTALDVTIQAQILELLRDLSKRLGVALVMITHNLGIVARYADRVNVMYAGRQVEQGESDGVFASPRHPYTVGLLGSVPRLDRPRTAELATIPGLPPNLMAPPSGCRFAPRCPFVQEQCALEPSLVDVAPGRRSACWRAGEMERLVTAAPPLPPAISTVKPAATPLLSAEGVTKHFNIGSRLPPIRAVDGVSLAIAPGETLGLVGESGCGKSTVGRLVLGLEALTAGEVRLGGEAVSQMRREGLRRLRRSVQVVFQDPFSSLNPRMTIGQIVAEPLAVHRIRPLKQIPARIEELLTKVGLLPYMATRYPHELSGGQRQRVGIARALAFEPQLIVCDEPVSALDVSIQGQVMNLLGDLKREQGLAYLFIAHDLAVVRHISDRVAVMYLGRIVELADADTLYRAPRHPYTRMLIDAVPIPDPVLERARQRETPEGEIPSPLNPPSGCVFRTRCRHAQALCAQSVPPLRALSDGDGRVGHQIACHRAEEIATP
jgi:peptide/nickel transport system ATP-binding protein